MTARFSFFRSRKRSKSTKASAAAERYRALVIKNTLLLTADLLIASQMPAGQGTLKVISKPAQAIEECNHSSIDMVAIDLTLPGLDIAGLVAELRSIDTPPSTIIAFGPHVQTARLQAAREAGCDEVISRGELHSRLPKLLA